jgi:hypothetical protein
VTLEGGGMPPVDLGGAATALRGSARPSLVEIEAREADEEIRPPA